MFPAQSVAYALDETAETYETEQVITLDSDPDEQDVASEDAGEPAADDSDEQEDAQSDVQVIVDSDEPPADEPDESGAESQEVNARPTSTKAPAKAPTEATELLGVSSGDLKSDGTVNVYNIQTDTAREWHIDIPADAFTQGDLTLTIQLPTYGITFASNTVADLLDQAEVISAKFGGTSASPDRRSLTVVLKGAASVDDAKDYLTTLKTVVTPLTRTQSTAIINNGWPENDAAAFKLTSDGGVSESVVFNMRASDGTGKGITVTRYSTSASIHSIGERTYTENVDIRFPVVGYNDASLFRMDEIHIYAPSDEFSLVSSNRRDGGNFRLHEYFTTDRVAHYDAVGNKYYVFKPSNQSYFLIYNDGLERASLRVSSTTLTITGQLTWVADEGFPERYPVDGLENTYGGVTYTSHDYVFETTGPKKTANEETIPESGAVFTARKWRLVDGIWWSDYAPYKEPASEDAAVNKVQEVVAGASYNSRSFLITHGTTENNNVDANGVYTIRDTRNHETYTFPEEIQPTGYSSTRPNVSGSRSHVERVQYTILHADGTTEVKEVVFSGGVRTDNGMTAACTFEGLGEGDRVCQVDVWQSWIMGQIESRFNFNVTEDAQGLLQIGYESDVYGVGNKKFSTAVANADSYIYLKVMEKRCPWMVSRTTITDIYERNLVVHIDGTDALLGSLYLKGEGGGAYRTSAENPEFEIKLTTSNVNGLDNPTMLLSGDMVLSTAMAGWTISYATVDSSGVTQNRTFAVPIELSGSYHLTRELLGLGDDDYITSFKMSYEGMWDFKEATRNAQYDYDTRAYAYTPIATNIKIRTWETGPDGQDVTVTGNYGTVLLGGSYSHEDECDRTAHASGEACSHNYDANNRYLAAQRRLIRNKGFDLSTTFSGSTSMPTVLQGADAVLTVGISTVATRRPALGDYNLWTHLVPLGVPESIYVELVDNAFEPDLSNQTFINSLAVHGLTADDVSVITTSDGKRFIKISTGDSIFYRSNRQAQNVNSNHIFIRDVADGDVTGFKMDTPWSGNTPMSNNITIALRAWSGATVGDHNPLGEVWYDLHELPEIYDGTSEGHYTSERLLNVVADEHGFIGDGDTETARLWKGDLSGVSVQVLRNQTLGTVLYPGKAGITVRDESVTFRASGADNLLASTTVNMPKTAVSDYVWTEKLPRVDDGDEYDLILLGEAVTYNNSLVNSAGPIDVEYTYSADGVSFVTAEQVSDFAEITYIRCSISASDDYGSLETRYNLRAANKPDGDKTVQITGDCLYQAGESTVESPITPVKYVFEDSKYAIEYYHQSGEDGSYADEPDHTDRPVYGTAGDTVDKSDYTEDGYALDSSITRSILTGVITELDDLVLRLFLKLQLTVTYEPGEHGSFDSDVHENLDWGGDTPEFAGKTDDGGNPAGEAGYAFTGWLPQVADRVTKAATYVAQWEPVDVPYTVEYYYQTDEGTWPSEPDFTDATREAKTESTVRVTDEDKVANASMSDDERFYVFDDQNNNNKLEAVVLGNGSTVLRVYFKQQISVGGTKTWVDADDAWGLRPDEITIKILANDDERYEKTVTAEDGWSWAWTGLDRFDASGAQIEYTVAEDQVPGYEAEIDGYNVTNKLKTTSVAVEKAWDNADGSDEWPTNVAVIMRLKADGRELDGKAVELSADQPSGMFEGLPTYKLVEGEEVEVSYTVAEDAVDGYEASYGDLTDGTITVTNTQLTTTIAGQKTWDDDNDSEGFRPSSITIRLLADGEEVDSKLVTSADDWAWSFEDVPTHVDGRQVVYTIVEDEVAEYTTRVSGFDITNYHAPSTVDITVAKRWVDGDNQDGLRPESITLNLLKVVEIAGDGSAITEQVDTHAVTADDGWTYTFRGLPKYENGAAISYRVTEDAVDSYEDPVVTGNMASGFVVRNVHTPEQVRIDVTKSWSDSNNRDGLRPDSITVRVLANGEEVRSAFLTSAGGWRTIIDGLPKYADGKTIVYTLVEDDVDEYTASYSVPLTGISFSFDGYGNALITNTHTAEVTSATVTKVWDDGENQDGLRPTTLDVTLVGGSINETVHLSESNDWTATVSNLPKNSDGRPISYTWTEGTAPAGYSASYEVSGSTSIITNKHVPATVEVAGAKTWDDANDQDGKRPEGITVRLLANGAEVASKQVTADDDWNWTFADQPKNAAGKEISYTIVEDEVDGYTTTVNGYDVTNSYTPETVDISGTKSWDDASDQDGIRPDSVALILTGTIPNGTTAKTVSTTKKDVSGEGNSWSFSFEGLPKYAEGGKVITYTVTEDAVEGYEASISGYDITNKHVPETTSVTVTKSWSDADNQDGIRPDSVTVNLLADGEVVDSATVTAGTKWSHEFTDLPKFAAGAEIVYTVTEDAVEGYESAVTGTATSGFTVTNTHTPETVDISGTKTWADADYLGQPGYERPESVTVRLIGEVTGADGTKDTVYSSADLTVTADDDWAYAWTDLAAYDAGRKISYRVVEVTIPDGYVATYDGASVTNTPVEREEQIEPVSLNINKTDSVTGNALAGAIFTLANADGDVVQTVTTDASGVATLTFTAAGTYSLTETAPTGYTSDPGTWTIEVTKSGVDNVSYDDPTEGVWTWTYHLELGKDYASGTLSVPNDPTLTDVDVSKVWADASDQDGVRPASVTFQLYKAVGDADPVAVEGKTVTLKGADDTWTATFEDLPAYEDGKAVTYTVDEVATPEGYTKEVSADGLTVTNTHAPVTVSVSGTKTWSDSDDQDGIRPESVTVNLLADGKAIDSTTATKDNGWKYTFTDLPKFAAGTEIKYTVTEDAVEGYTATVSGYDISNAHMPETIDISGTKSWSDADDQDGIRPDSVTVNLLADGKAIDSTTATAANGWKYSFTGLPKFAAGTEIVYTVTEDAVEGYTATVSGYDISNAHTPATVDVSGTKTWADADYQGIDGYTRPESIRVQVIGEVKAADGTVSTAYTGSVLTVTAADDWAYSWAGLPARSAGQDIAYRVVELDVPAGFGATYSGTDVTNTPVEHGESIEPVSLDIAKTDAVTGNALAGATFTVTNEAGTQLAAATTDANGKATLTFDAVGTYTLTETAPTGYTSDPGTWTVVVERSGVDRVSYNDPTESVWTWFYHLVFGKATSFDGTTLAVANEPVRADVTATKVWDDVSDHDALRPDSVTFQLYKAVGEAEAAPVEGKTATLKGEGDEWEATFEALPTYEDGKAVTYSVRELDAEGVAVPLEGGAFSDAYTAEYAEDGLTVTNTHELILSDFTFAKLGQDADAEALAGATFALFTDAEATKPFVGLTEPATDPAEAKSADDGTVTLTDLPYGTYWMRETEAPEGYLANDAIYQLVVAADAGPVLTVATPATSQTGELAGTAEDGFTIQNVREVGQLRIEKTLDRIQSGDRATFVFDVVATLDGAVVYSNVAAIHFTGPGTDSVTLANIPAGATVTVTEAYSGASYQVVGAGTASTQVVGGDVVSVAFENDYDGSARTGNGIQNHYERDGKVWVPTQQTTNVDEAAATPAAPAEE